MAVLEAVLISGIEVAKAVQVTYRWLVTDDSHLLTTQLTWLSFESVNFISDHHLYVTCLPSC